MFVIALFFNFIWIVLKEITIFQFNVSFQSIRDVCLTLVIYHPLLFFIICLYKKYVIFLRCLCILHTCRKATKHVWEWAKELGC